MICKLLFISYFSLFFFAGDRRSLQCDSLVLKVEVEQAKSNRDLFIVEVSVENATPPVRYFFSDIDGELFNEGDYLTNRVELTKPGRYVCRIRDGSDCGKRIEFVVP